MIPENHPRRDSLRQRDLLVEGYRSGATALQGLIAFGRGEAFDYLLGEKTHSFARKAVEAAAASLLLSNNPVISVNGNTAVLCPDELIALSKVVNARIEINLFHRTQARIRIIENLLREKGCDEVYGIHPTEAVPGLVSNRGLVDKNGIYRADTVLVALEDGDRTESLKKMNKRVIAIDLNPLSRTAQMAHITIVDNIIRAAPLLKKEAHRLKSRSRESLEELRLEYDNKDILEKAVQRIRCNL